MKYFAAAALLLGAASAVYSKPEASNLRSRDLQQDEVVYGKYLEGFVQYEDKTIDGHMDSIELPNGRILDIEDADDAD
jgi:hypothetical protein